MSLPPATGVITFLLYLLVPVITAEVLQTMLVLFPKYKQTSNLNYCDPDHDEAVTNDECCTENSVM